MTTSETAIKANEREATRLFERGVAAARGGQRRVAAGLLARAVQLNPRHEASWLWLSGMLDDPSEIAFCLRSVLALNPENERARQGLAWLEQRALIGERAPAPQTPALPAALTQRAAPEARRNGKAEAEPEAPRRLAWPPVLRVALPKLEPDPQAALEQEQHARHHGEAWWVNFRRSRRDMSRVRLVFWSVPLLLLLLTLALNLALRTAVERNEALALEAAIAAERPALASASPGAPPQAEVLLVELPPAQDARVLAYLSALAPQRTKLQLAVEEYRAATSRPGGSSIAHAAAARRLRDGIEGAYSIIEGLRPPESLAQPHAYYLSGLEMELAALDDMLEFYSSFSIEIANRATLRMEQADRHLERARRDFDRRKAQVAAPPVLAHFAR